MQERSKGVGQLVKEAVSQPRNKERVNDLLIKMGRVLAKKRSLNNEQPIQIYEDRIWLGNYVYAGDKQFLLQNNIRTVISCVQLSLPLFLPNIQYVKFNLKDSQDVNFSNIVNQFYNVLTNTRGNIYVHWYIYPQISFSGVSRSPALIISYIMRREKISYEAAASKIKTLYPLANPNHYFQQTLREIELKYISQANLPVEQKSLTFDLLGHESPPLIPQKSPVKVQQQNQNLLNMISDQPQSKQLNILDQQPQYRQQLLVQADYLIGKIQDKLFQNEKVVSPTKTYNQNINLLDIQNQVNQSTRQANQSTRQANQSTRQVKQQNQLQQTLPEQMNLLQQSTRVSLQPERNFINIDQPQKIDSRQPIKIEDQSEDLLDIKPSYSSSVSHNVQQIKSQLKTQLQQKPVIQKDEEFIEQADFSQKKQKKNKKKKR